MTQRLISTLETGTILVGLEAASLAEAVRALLAPSLSAGNLDLEKTVEAVLQREETGSTCSGEVALPHARVAGVPGIIAGFGINRNAIYGDVRFVLAFVSPQDAPGDHLRFLSEAAKVFRNEALLEQLLEAKNREEVLVALT